MRNALILVVVAELVAPLGSTEAAERRPDAALVASIRNCAQAEQPACEQVASTLAIRLGGDVPADHALGLRLGRAAASVLAHPPPLVAAAVESCRDGNGRACVTVAQVLDGLFTGDDARLARSTDRQLARDLAAVVMAEDAK